MMKLSFSAVSRIGQLSAANDDIIYTNGKFTDSREMDNVQLSFESQEKQFLFAVSEGMECYDEEPSPGISITEELVKFQKKSKNSIKDLQNKLEDITGCVEQLNNLLYSMSIGDETKKGRKPSIAGVIIDGSKAAAINMGSCRAYKLEPENLRPLANDYKRTERLLKMGIITDEQAELLSSQLGATKSDSLSQVRRSDIFKVKEQDVLLICSNGLTEAVTEDTIFEILSSDGDTDVIAGLLVNEAVKNGAKDNVTAAVIKILSVDEEAEASKSTSQSFSRRLNSIAGTVGKKKMDTAKLVSSLVMFVVIAAVLFGTISLINSLRPSDKSKAPVAQNSVETTAGDDINEAGSTTEATSTTTDPNAGQQSQDPDTQASEATSTINPGNSGDGTVTKYTIKKGDSLFTISKKFYGDSNKYKLIMEANNIKDPNKIVAGQELNIPASE